jgi:DNA-binding MarR family transcriptional regulator
VSPQADAPQRERAAADVETRAHEDDHEALRLWLRLLACSRLIENTVRRRLHAELGTTLPRFDLLAQLERAPDGLRMSELSERLMVTGGNVTGIVDLLESERLVRRERDRRDQRASRVVLTAEGLRSFRRMARAHEGWIVELFEALPARERRRLGESLARLKRALVAGGGTST